ncbi:MAG: hypothetical protein L0338_21680 [Acidobacteria bacterium]|nr:hypothetical protein [Acidobacteriota bacterium]
MKSFGPRALPDATVAGIQSAAIADAGFFRNLVGPGRLSEAQAIEAIGIPSNVRKLLLRFAWEESDESWCVRAAIRLRSATLKEFRRQMEIPTQAAA